MVSALAKKYFALMLGFFIMAHITTAFIWPIPLQGKIKLDLDISNLTLNLNKDNEAADAHNLYLYPQLIGKGLLRISNITEKNSQSLIIFSQSSPAGSMEILWKNSSLEILNLTLKSSLNASLCLPHDEDKLLCVFSFAALNQTPSFVFELYYSIDMDNFSSEFVNMTLIKNGFHIGSMSLDFLDIKIDYPNINKIVEYYRGNVKSINQGVVASGELKIKFGEDVDYFKIQNGKYGEGQPIRVFAPIGAKAEFYVNNVLAGEDSLDEDEKINNMDIIYPLSIGKYGYPDTDRDGIPDKYDKCPASESRTVDRSGCDCEQIYCEGMCFADELTPRCLQTCNDGIKSKQCNSLKKISGKAVSENDCEDCRQCGCQEPFSCQQDGSCAMQVNLQGKKCKTNDFQYRLKEVDCAIFGKKSNNSVNTWIKEDIKKIIKVDVSGFPLIIVNVNNIRTF